MPTTPARSLPYPSPTGQRPDGPYSFQQIAESVEAQLVAMGRLDGGQTAALAVAGLAAGGVVSTTVTFATTFTAAPRVTASVNGAGAGTNYLVARVAAVTTTQVTILIYNNSAAAVPGGTGAVPVDWIARQGGV